MSTQPTRAVPHTWQVKTGSGGLHFIFDNTEAKVRNGELDRGVDLRGVGGYIVGPYSKHASGRTYKCLPQNAPGEAPLASPPDWLLTIINAAAAQLKHTTHSEYVRQALLRCLEADGVKIRRGTVEVT